MDVFIEFFSSLPFADEIVGAVLPVLIGLVFGFAKDVCKRVWCLLRREGLSKSKAFGFSSNTNGASCRLHERHDERNRLRELAFADAGRPVNSAVYQIASVVYFEVIAILLAIVSAYTGMECLQAISLLFMLLAFLPLLCILLEILSLSDIKSRYKGIRRKRDSRRSGLYLDLGSVRELAAKYSKCITINAQHFSGKPGRGLSESLDLCKFKNHLDLIEGIDEDALVLVYSDYGAESYTVAAELSAYNPNVYDLGGIAYRFDYYKREIKAMLYQQDEGMLKEYDR